MIPTVTPRIEIELTSRRDDDTWTWRAAGARQPRGHLDAGILYEGAKVGDVVHAEAEFFMDGISITTIQPRRTRQPSADRLEIMGSPRGAPPQAGGGGPRHPSNKPLSARRSRDIGGDGDSDRARSAGGSPRRRQGSSGGGNRGKDEGPRPDQSSGTSTAGAPSRQVRARERPARLVPGTTHRDFLLSSLQSDQRMIAEQLLRGGIPAVRRALDQRNENARSSGKPVVDSSGIISVAEELVPRVNAAVWLDKAEAASKRLNDVPLRDLRSVVAGAGTLTLDEPSRMLAATLRDALNARVTASRERWLSSIDQALSSDDVLDALNRSARPPDPGARFPADLAVRLAERTSEALNPGLAPDSWHDLLAAALHCPARRMIKPKGLPAPSTPELLNAARQASAQIPHLAALLGMSMPPPPPRPAHYPRPDRGRLHRDEQSE